MDIAREKRDENIAEYILYIWQLEDLLRALQFSPEAAFTALVAPREADDKWKLAALEWYMDIADLLQKEDKVQNGHLDHTLHLVADMNDLHLTLMQQPVGRKYRELFARLAPELPGLRRTLGRDDAGDIELALRALYAAMLYRMKGAVENKGTVGGAGKNGGQSKSAGEVADKNTKIADEVVALVSPVVAMLSDLYLKAERGEIDLYKE